jgi:hypothetical protein
VVERAAYVKGKRGEGTREKKNKRETEKNKFRSKIDANLKGREGERDREEGIHTKEATQIKSGTGEKGEKNEIQEDEGET